MAKKEGWGKPGAAGLADGTYVLQFVEFGNRNKGLPGFFEFEEREGEETPSPRVSFNALVLDGPAKIGEVLSISQKWGGIDIEDGEVLFRCRGARTTAFILWLAAFGMKFPSEDDPGDTVLAEPPDPNAPISILVSLETILKEKATQGCLAQAEVGDFTVRGQVIKGRFIWDSARAVAEKLAKSFLEGTPVLPAVNRTEKIRDEIKSMVRDLQGQGGWSFAEARDHLEKEYEVKTTKELNLGQLEDFHAFVQELYEEKGVIEEL